MIKPNEINHIILSRMAFPDKSLFRKYLSICKSVLVPSLVSQTNKNFKWAVLILPEDVELARNYLKHGFLPFHNVKQYFDYVKENEMHIQTRHDMDDWMAPTYIQRLQELYEENIEKFGTFLIQVQPLLLQYGTKEESKMRRYTEKNTSMFLSLCQTDVKHHILEKRHGAMHEIAKDVITIEGYTKWVIHGENISCKRGAVIFKNPR